MKVGDLLISKSRKHIAILLECRTNWITVATNGKVFTISRKAYEVLNESR